MGRSSYRHRIFRQRLSVLNPCRLKLVAQGLNVAVGCSTTTKFSLEKHTWNQKYFTGKHSVAMV